MCFFENTQLLQKSRKNGREGKVNRIKVYVGKKGGAKEGKSKRKMLLQKSILFLFPSRFYSFFSSLLLLSCVRVLLTSKALHNSSFPMNRPLLWHFIKELLHYFYSTLSASFSSYMSSKQSQCKFLSFSLYTSFFLLYSLCFFFFFFIVLRPFFFHPYLFSLSNQIPKT